WESTLSDRDIRSIAPDTDISIVGPLYVDSLSEPDGDAANYVAMMRHNAELIRRALLEEEQGAKKQDEEQQDNGGEGE
ncbi:metal ABC transporter solute-binding protein, Zn/Mn family, partial [Billgrantia bachuensis]|uniref:metal ABC transporter solute-binding protein, Zn/Mn family n=1 Tax=Billgrantia bachuensis TaxID=2717286 RepID=UPI001F105C59